MIGTMGIPVMTTKPENELPLRHELKHRINLREDLVLSQRSEDGGGEIWFDDKVVRRDGLFVLPELMDLNPDRILIKEA